MKFESVRPFSESNLSFEASKIVLIGIPLDITTSFRCGTRFAPSVVREISWHLEDYNYLTDENILDSPFYDMGDLFLLGNLEKNIKEIRDATVKILNNSKIPLIIGGEHLITYPIIQAISNYYSDLNVIFFDAHTDLGDHYRQRYLSHASVIRLVYDILGDNRIFIFGLRTGTKEDKDFMKGKIVSSYEPPSDKIIDKLKDKPVYISIDMDVLDPSIAPGVGTPELLGWSYRDLYNTIRRFSIFKNIVGADIVEICPPYDKSEITGLIGANLVRELMFLIKRVYEK